jgi:hypothetical protein
MSTCCLLFLTSGYGAEIFEKEGVFFEKEATILNGVCGGRMEVK